LLRLPLFLDLAGKQVVVVGAGAIASTKVTTLLATGASVTIVAPWVSPALAHTKAAIVNRRFRASDLDGAWLAVAAATPSVNSRVVRAAHARHIFADSASDANRASAHFASTLRRGQLTVAVSTSGMVPALSRLVRQSLEELLPHELDEWLEVAAVERLRWQRAKTPYRNRVPLLARAIGKLYRPKRTVSRS
jgi:siroheme synthase-like protein